jgi:hypothetical protein
MQILKMQNIKTVILTLDTQLSDKDTYDYDLEIEQLKELLNTEAIYKVTFVSCYVDNNQRYVYEYKIKYLEN